MQNIQKYKRNRITLLLHEQYLVRKVGTIVPKAVWKIFKPRNFPSQHWDSAGSLLENFYSATSKE
jgi:hypothetical protein